MYKHSDAIFFAQPLFALGPVPPILAQLLALFHVLFGEFMLNCEAFES